jgi:hypothetical protein
LNKTGYLDTIMELLPLLNEIELGLVEKEICYLFNEKYGG